MKKIYPFAIVFLLFAFCNNTLAQPEIMYADVNRADVQRMNFEIIGKTANNYLIYKEIKGRHWISVYDENMRELENVPISVLPSKSELMDVTFFSSGNGAWLIYQFQKENVVYCEAAKVEANGRILDVPKLLDTTIIAYKADNRIYNTLINEDGSKIMLFKINRKDRTLYHLATRLFDNQLITLNSGMVSIPMNPDGDYLSGYSLDNDGNLVFVKYNRMKSGEIGAASLMVKPFQKDELDDHSLNINNLFLDDIKVKIDDKNNQVSFSFFYSEKKKGNLTGLYTYAWDKKNNSFAYEKTTSLTEEMLRREKGKSKSKSAYNDYFINNIVLDNNGGFTVGAEVLYSTNYGSMYDRWGYWGSPYFGGPYGSLYGGWYGWGGWSPWSYGWGRFGYWSPYYYYSPFFYRSYWWGDYGYSGSQRFHAGNVVLFAFDKDGNKEWDNVIVKSQSSTNTDATISYLILNKGSDLHVVLNNSGKISDLENISVNNSGNIYQENPLQAKDKSSEFMPRYAKQINDNEVIMPVLTKKNIQFAKVKL